MRILVLEDGHATQLLVKRRLERYGYEVDAVDSFLQGFHMAKDIGWLRAGDTIAVIDGKQLTAGGLEQFSRLQQMTVGSDSSGEPAPLKTPHACAR